MAKTNKFGTFGGVFVPSILTILGVIMYLRLPMIVGEAGLWATLGIIVIAHVISVTTGLSVSSIATDRKVEAGGTYYMISRSLGLPIGGTLGLALFIGLSFSVSLYLIGFSESFLAYWGFENDISNIRITGTIVLIAVTTLTFISTSFAIKTQYFILVAIVLSLLSIFLGDHDFAPVAPVFTNPTSTISLMVLFGIFFPAVTGFEAGVSMSGDLKDPKKSIPRGSILAIVVGLVVYIGLAFYFTYTVDGAVLVNDPQVLLNISWIPELVIAGIWGATLSSALGSILGAPRILQATAVDKISPRFFAKRSGASNEPRNALLLTFAIAEAGILIGQLDVIARVVSIFFITTYGFLNMSAAFERWTSADFRPEFKVSGWVSLIGALACILVMLQLDFVAMLSAILLLGLLFLFLKRRQLTLESGDAWSGVWAALVKKGLSNLTKERLHSRNWRANVIMFSGNPHTRQHMVDMGKAIAGSLGMLSAFELIKAEGKVLAKSESNLAGGKKIGYFHHKLYCSNVYEGMDQIARVYGFSGVEPNTVLMGWSKQPTNKEQFIELISGFGQNHYNTLFLNYNAEKGYGNHRTIDVWWSGVGQNLGLAINILRQITNSILWKQAKIRLLIINPNNAEVENVYRAAEAILDSYRLEAIIRIVNNETDPISESEIVSAESAHTDLVLLGLPDKRFQHLEKYYGHVNDILEGIGSTIIINASDEFEEHIVIHPKTKSLVKGVSAAEEVMVVPDLIPSQYPEIAQDIERIDVNGSKVLKLLYKKTFEPVFSDHEQVLVEFGERVDFIKKELDKIHEIPEHFKKKKAISKLKNEVFFKIETLISEEFKEKKLTLHKENLEKGIAWYQNRLRNDFLNYPSTMRVSYAPSAFAKDKTDAAGLKLYKFWKRTKNRIFGGSITQKVNYREVARYYQLHSREVFLYSVLERFLHEEGEFYTNIRGITSSMIANLADIERKIESDNPNWGAGDFQLLSERISQLLADRSKTARHYQMRLKVEYRKNLQQMSEALEEVGVDSIVSKKKKSKKYYEGVAEKTEDFSGAYEVKFKTMLNKVLMELAVNRVNNRLENLFEEYKTELSQTIKTKYLKGLTIIMKQIDAEEGEIELSKVKIDPQFDTDLQESFGHFQSRVIALSEEMPEALDIYSLQSDSQEAETLSVPIARMTEHYLKTRYNATAEDAFEVFLEQLKRSVYSAQDAVNLATLSFENSKKEGELTTDEFLKVCYTKLEIETKRVEDATVTFTDKIEVMFNNVFEPLSSMRIEESAEDFLSNLRSYQGRQVISGMGAIWDHANSFFQRMITRLFYSRSEGILLAKRLNKDKQLASPTSQLLSLSERLNPKADVLKALPQYYVTLFNGKSTISKEFWVEREQEESQFKRAVRRYRSGYAGGVLLLGDRNSGKTAFSRHLTSIMMKANSVFILFPPTQGSVVVHDFHLALAKATQKSGNARQILTQLPKDAIVIINDMELFWERSSDGLAVVELLLDLIDEFGHKVLFIVNMNPYAYKLINQMTHFSDRFIEVVNMMPFDANELKDLVLKRHRSSRLAFSIQADGGEPNQVQIANLFNKYFNYSGGNPGTALQGWLSNIKKVSKESLKIAKPDEPSLDVLKSLNEDWTMILVQYVLHKRLTEEKIARITQWPNDDVRRFVLAMLRSGILIEKTSGIYHIDPFVQPFVVEALKEREVLS